MVAIVLYYAVVFVIVAIMMAWGAIKRLEAFNKAPIHKRVVEIAQANVKMDRSGLRAHKHSPFYKRALIGLVIMGFFAAIGWTCTASAFGLWFAACVAIVIEQTITMHIARQNDVPMDLAAEAAAAAA